MDGTQSSIRQILINAKLEGVRLWTRPSFSVYKLTYRESIFPPAAYPAKTGREIAPTRFFRSAVAQEQMDQEEEA